MMDELLAARTARILEECAANENEMLPYFMQGYDAYVAGMGCEANPYPKDSNTSKAWADGHAEACIDDFASG